MARRSLSPQLRSRGVTAVLGPTNTGKTHLAIERMLGHGTGMIGLPLRLLAREVYGRVVERVGPAAVALVTGEEKIKPDNPRYWISTVEAMPRDLDLSFVAVDEVQLASDLDRGHVFTDRLLNQRGRDETLLIGSATVRPLIEALIPGVHVVTRPRLSNLTFAGEKKLSRLPRRSAIVAFSAEEVYAIAELIRRQRGGAAVVLGALSPRTRNAQVELYQSGEVDYLVATDAVGMGLNLDVDHVAFAADRKFDGFRFRKLFPAEFAQIAGRAGRHLRDGTFGTTGRCGPFEPELIEALEAHRFDPSRVLQWRNPDLDFSSLAKLQESLAETPREPGLTRAPVGEDVAALELVGREDDIRGFARSPDAVERLWEVCQVPDYRKVSAAGHADLVGQLYRFLMSGRGIPADWFNRQVTALDRIEGDIDALSNRIAQIRTWSFVANRPDWLPHPKHWQGVTRQVEDKLSDALHERLASRFVDRRTSVLMRRLRENVMLEAEITAAGEVTVEGQHVGSLLGFHFVPDPQAGGDEAAKTLRNAANKALAGEIEARAERFSAAADAALVLSNDGTVRWQGDPVGKLEPGDLIFEPRIRILADELLAGPSREKVEARLNAWLKALVVRLLGPVLQLQTSAELTGLARGIAYQIAEALGVLERSRVVQEMRSLDQDGRGALRRQGVRFGAYHIYLPALLKPAPRILATQLWALKNGGLDQKGLDVIAHLASSGRTSIPVDPEIARGLYRSAGFRVCGARAVRVDILERLADLIRPAAAYRPGVTPGPPPPGAADGEWFAPTVGMTSLVGCSGDDFGSILRSLGYVSESRPGPAITVPLLPAATPVPPPAAEVETPEAAFDAASEAAVWTPAAEESGAASGGEDLTAGETMQADGGGDPAAAGVGQDASPPAMAGREEAPLSEAAALALGAAVAPDVVEDPAAPDAGPAAAEAPPPLAAEPPAIEPDPVDVQGRGLDSAGLAPSTAGDLAEAVLTEASPDRGSPAPPEADAVLHAPESDATGPEISGPDASASAEAGPPEAPPEPVMIEVWRLQRQREHHHRPQRRARGGQEGAGEPRPEGVRPHQDRQRRGGGRPNHRPAADALATAAAGPAQDSRGPSPNARPEGGRPGRGRDRRQGEHRGDQQRAPAEARQGSPEGRPRPDHRPGGPDRRPRPENRHGGGETRPQRRERPPDPDSPFAKLLALKAQLEERDGEKR